MQVAGHVAFCIAPFLAADEEVHRQRLHADSGKVAPPEMGIGEARAIDSRVSWPVEQIGRELAQGAERFERGYVAEADSHTATVRLQGANAPGAAVGVRCASVAGLMCKTRKDAGKRRVWLDMKKCPATGRKREETRRAPVGCRLGEQRGRWFRPAHLGQRGLAAERPTPCPLRACYPCSPGGSLSSARAAASSGNVVSSSAWNRGP